MLAIEVGKPITFYTGLVLFILSSGGMVNVLQSFEPGELSWVERNLGESESLAITQGALSFVVYYLAYALLRSGQFRAKLYWGGRGPGPGGPSAA